MQKYLDMENVPKTFRATLLKQKSENPAWENTILKQIKSTLCEDIKNNNAYIQEIKKNEFDKTSIKLMVHSNKMNIFMHNGDLYNLFRELKKFKKLSFIAIEEMETKMELGDPFNYPINLFSSINLFSFETNNENDNEGAYLNICNNLKNHINNCEKFLNKLMKEYNKLHNA